MRPDNVIDQTSLTPVQAGPFLQVLASPRLDAQAPVREVQDQFLATLASAHTQRGYSRHLHHAFDLLGIGSLGELHGGHLVAYRAAIMGDGRGAATHAQAIIAMRSFLTWAAAMEGHHLHGDQINGLLKVPGASVLNPYQVLTPKECLAFLRAAFVSSTRNFAIAMVALGSGLRVAEIANLDRGDLKEDSEGGWVVHVRQGKGAKDRLVPIQRDVVWALQNHMKEPKKFGEQLSKDSPLFLADDYGSGARGRDRISTRSIARLIKKLCIESGVPQDKKISPHSLRHTFALAALRTKRDMMAVSKLLGHSVVGTTQRYVNHLNLLEIRECVPIWMPELLASAEQQVGN